MSKGRPKKTRIISNEPQIRQFSPRGRHGRPDYVTLTLEEAEAVKLIDLESRSQIQAAKSMGISQQTVSRILNKGRRLLADALINGKIIKLAGGSYSVNQKVPAQNNPTNIE